MSGWLQWPIDLQEHKHNSSSAMRADYVEGYRQIHAGLFHSWQLIAAQKRFSEEAMLDNVESIPARNREVWPSRLLSATQHVTPGLPINFSVSQSKTMTTKTNAYLIGFCVGMWTFLAQNH